MMEFLPHLVLTVLVGGAAALFLEKGRERRDLLFMGISAALVALWMVSVIMTDVQVGKKIAPVFWLAVSVNALLPALFFTYISVLQLEHYYAPERQIQRRDWLPLAIVISALAIAHALDPELFYRNVQLVLANRDKVSWDPKPNYNLHYSLGPGYFLFLAAAGYVIYNIAVRFPRIVEAMHLPEAERRTRALLSLGVMAAFWAAAFDILPALFSTVAPSFMRLVGPALGLAGAFYAMVLARALDPKAVFRNAIFYVIRILLIAVPSVFVVSKYQVKFAGLGPRRSALAVLVAVIVVDYIVLRLKPLLDWLALRKSYNSVEAINRYVHDLLVLRDTRDFSRTVKDFLRSTIGVGEVRLFVPPLDNPKTLIEAEDGEGLQLPADTRQALIARDCATTPEDVQLDPRLYSARDQLGELFEKLTAEVLVPLADEGRLIGLLVVGFKESFDEYYDQDLDLLDTLRKSTALSLSNTLQFELARMGKPVKVYDREEFDEALARQWQQARRANESVGLALLRLADPVAFDREFGPGRSQEFVRLIGEKLRPTLRGRDIPAYFDGHTLALLLPQTRLQGAEIAGRRIRTWLESNNVEDGGQVMASRFVVGVAARENDAMPPDALVTAAEEALRDVTAIAESR